MVAMNTNTKTYPMNISSSNVTIELQPADANNSSIIVYNDSTTSVFVQTSATAQTAVFPTANPDTGAVVGPGLAYTLTKNPGDRFVNAIQEFAGSGRLYIKPGAGE